MVVEYVCGVCGKVVKRKEDVVFVRLDEIEGSGFYLCREEWKIEVIKMDDVKGGM